MSSNNCSPLCLPTAVGDRTRGYIKLNISYKMDMFVKV